MEQLIRTYEEQKMMLTGQPFEILIDTISHQAGFANGAGFTLDTSDYDVNGDGQLETRPFYGQLLDITGMRAICGQNVTLGGVNIDNRTVITSGASDLYLINQAVSVQVVVEAMQKAYGGAGLDKYGPSIEKIFGVKALICRSDIWVWMSATQGNDVTLAVRGWAFPNRKQ